jgi:DNA polymerase (family 10)
MENADIARVLSDLADLLEIQDGNPFRVRAYRNAARTVDELTKPLRKMVAEGGDLTALPGIGKEMASHIRELLASGKLGVLEELAAKVPRGLLDLVRLPGLGPKKARLLHDELGIRELADLERAARAGEIAKLKGFGAKTQDRILQSLGSGRRETRWSIAEADSLVAELRAHLEGTPGLERLEPAGSFRRRRETVGDVDLIAIAKRPAPLVARFLAYPGVTEVVGSGDTKASVRLRSGIQVDLRILPRKSFGAAMVYFTGSKAHNIRLRQMGVERGLRISEYGVFEVGQKRARAEVQEGEPAQPVDPWSGKLLAGREEKDVYASVGLPWIPPELREDRGEIDAATRAKLPKLIELADLRGDLQMHSTWSDGAETIEAMLQACAARGYEYFAMTDHSPALAMVRGLDARRLRQQATEIAKLQETYPKIRILRAMEVDILADGRLDMDDESLASLDLVVASVHSKFDLEPAAQTARLLAAMRHPLVHVWGHPTGRRLGRREAMVFDIDEVLGACASAGVAVEINAQPQRLDLKDTHAIRARELGCRFVVSTDAHRPAELDFMRYGVEQARRAWLTKKDVLNTLPLGKFLGVLRPT